MKRLLLFFLFVSGTLHSQVVNIPDANFKAKLLEANTSNSIAQDEDYNRIKIDINNNGQIEVGEALRVYDLNVSLSNISSLQGVEAFQNLRLLDCDTNQISVLNTLVLPNLEFLDCGYNPLTSVSFSTNLYQLWFSGINMSTLDLHLPNLFRLVCQNNPNLTSLDLSDLPSLISLLCDGNSSLVSVNLKNGISETQVSLTGHPNLVYICTDEPDVISMQQHMESLGQNVNVNSYCSFTPGGRHNTITGLIRHDYNNNGCDASDEVSPFIKVKINDGVEQGSTITNADGKYAFYTPPGNFTVSPDMENPSFFTVNPETATANFVPGVFTVANRFFCLSANGVHPDVEVVIAPVVPARPGFEAVYKIVYKNKGNQRMTQNSGISFSYNPQLMQIINIDVAPQSQAPGLITWNYSNLRLFESRSILVKFRVNAPTDPNPVNIDDILNFNASIFPLADENPADNLFELHQKVIGSFDPNDIECLQGDVVPATQIGKYLHYLIRFENTGTASAQNIVIKDLIDPAKYDISSIQILDSSHPVMGKTKGNVTEMIFKDIYLESGGHGNILLKIKSLPNLAVGSTVTNKASIFFDYNFPVDTNDANTVFQALSRGEHKFDNSVSAYPNPANGLVNIKASSAINSIEMYDVQGRILMTSFFNQTEAIVDLENYSSGIYYLKIKTDNGSKIEKVIKK